jgi:hypothetical protein
VKDDLVVPDGGACELAGTRVTGDVRVGDGASLTVLAGARLEKSLVCDPGSSCTLAGATVEKDIEARGTLSVTSTTIERDLACKGVSCTLAQTVVHKDLAVTAGTLAATGITVHHDLTCAGEACTLEGSRVGHDAVVKAGTFAASGAQIDQDLRCEGAGCELTGTSVRKDVVATAGTLALRAGSSVGDDLVCGGEVCTLEGSRVARDVDVKAGTLDSTDADVGDDLVCGGTLCTLTTTDVADDVTLRPGERQLHSYASTMVDLLCDGAFCNLDTLVGDDDVRTVVRNDIRAGKDAYVSARLTQIGDDVTCVGCRATDLFDSTIGGDVESVGQTQGGLYCNNDIGGSLSFSLNKEYFITCGGNRIGGHLLLARNGGVLSVIGNVVGQTISLLSNDTLETALYANQAGKAIICERNRPQPVGAGNVAPTVDRDCGDITGPLE